LCETQKLSFAVFREGEGYIVEFRFFPRRTAAAVLFFAPCHKCLTSLQCKIKNQSAKHALSEVEGRRIKEVIPACRDFAILMFGLSFLILSERTSSRIAGISQYDTTY